MTGNDLLELMNNGPLQGRSIDIADFLVRANMAIKEFEGSRNWVRLQEEKSTNTSLTSDTFETPHTLPDNFRRTLPRRTLILVNPINTNEYYEYSEVPFAKRFQYQNSADKFYIDHKNGNYYVCGTVSKTLTHHFFFMPIPVPLEAETEWDFGIQSSSEEYIPYQVSARIQLGEDYDDINARNANANFALAQNIWRTAVKDDDSLQRSALGV